MRVCVPTTSEDGASAELSDHFGRAPYYTIVDTATDEYDVVQNRSKHRGGSKMPPTFVADQDVDAVLVDHVGKRGMKLFEKHDIDVYQTGPGTVEEIVGRFTDGDLAEFRMEDAHGHGHGGGHGHGHSHGAGHNHDHSHGEGHDDGHDH